MPAATYTVGVVLLLVWGEALPIHVMVYGRFERGRPRSGRSRVRFVLFLLGGPGPGAGGPWDVSAHVSCPNEFI